MEERSKSLVGCAQRLGCLRNGYYRQCIGSEEKEEKEGEGEGKEGRKVIEGRRDYSFSSQGGNNGERY